MNRFHIQMTDIVKRYEREVLSGIWLEINEGSFL